MNFFRDRKLARRLKNNEVSSKEQFIYYLLLCLGISISTTATLNSEQITLNFYTYASDALSVAFTLLITVICYIANTKGDGKDFIARSVCITFPVIIQTFFVCIIFGLSLLLIPIFLNDIPISEILNGSEDRLFFLRTIFLSLIPTYLYFTWRMYTSILIASGAKE